MSLPIDAVLPDLISELSRHSAVVLEAPPGAGKTTRVPLALLEQAWLEGRSILMLEPRRLAARNAATYMAQCLGEQPGETVGYRVRFDNRVSAKTRIEVITEGILTRRLQQDPELAGVGMVIFDEFHERNLHSDLALALCRDAQQGLREDLKVLVMSATLDAQGIAETLSAPVVRSEGRSFPVDIRYLPREPKGHIADITSASLGRILSETEGDLLVFLPGAGEIRRVAEQLKTELATDILAIHCLYGDLPFAEQQQAIRPATDGRRKLVLATAIAETSLTIEGVHVVVDCGWQRVPRFDPRSGLSHLETVRVSRASAEQRAGRAGRLGPGICYRLWGEGTQRGLVPYNAPEIQEADLAPLALELAQWGVSDPTSLQWIDLPPSAPLSQAQSLLMELEALDEERRITPHGERMAELPLHPRLAHMLVRAEEQGLGALACDVAAVVSERDPLRMLEGPQRCDFALRVEVLRSHRERGNPAARAYGADPKACTAAERAARQWRHLLQLQAENSAVDEYQVGALLALAYPDRVAMQRGKGRGRYLMANGRGAALTSGCATSEPWLVAASVSGRGGEGRIFLAAPIEAERLETLFSGHIRYHTVIAWDSSSESVSQREERRLGSLVLSARPPGQADADAVSQAMLQGIREMGLNCLPWDRSSRQLQARVISLRQWLPDESWPDFSEKALLEELEQWLLPYLTGITRREHLGKLALERILLDRLDWQQQQRLAQAAPAELRVPSGANRRLEYSAEAMPPVLAVKLQEMFGQAETPVVADGRVAVMLHLLSPAQRPLQVTQDLKSFWSNIYPEVKKEMKGRYPKHPWPDDPWNALPTAATKKRAGKS